MSHKIVLLLIALQISFISCYAKQPNIPPELKQFLSQISSEKNDNDMSYEDKVKWFSKILQKKIVMPINIQAINQDNYLLYERKGAENTKTVKTYCVVKHIKADGVSKNINTLNNIDLFKIMKMYKVNKDKYIVVGYEQDMTKSSTHQAVAMLIDRTGKTIWKTIVGTSKSYSEAMVETHNGDYMVVGHDWVTEIEDKFRGNYHVMVAKVNANGSKIWTKHYSPNGRFAKARNVEKTNDGGFVIIGETSNKAWIFKIDALGKKVWETFLDTQRTDDRAYSISDNHQDGYIIAGMSNGHGLDKDKSWIIKVNYSGKIEFNISVGIKEPFMIQTVSQLNSNEFMITGFYPGAMSSNSFFMKIDLDGNQISEKIVQLKH